MSGLALMRREDLKSAFEEAQSTVLGNVPHPEPCPDNFCPRATFSIYQERVLDEVKGSRRRADHCV